MSRSRKKTPIQSVCIIRAGEMKKWKKKSSRVFRRIPIDKDIPNHKKYGKILSCPSDGKQYMKDKEKRKKWMRK